MKESVLIVDKRIQVAISSYNTTMVLREDGPLIDPNSCEIINECRLESAMVSTYERHINSIKSYFLSTSSILKRYLASIGMVGDMFEITITIVACAEYVAATYLENSYSSLFQILDLIIASIFFLDWIIHLIIADKKLDFLTNLHENTIYCFSSGSIIKCNKF